MLISWSINLQSICCIEKCNGRAGSEKLIMTEAAVARGLMDEGRQSVVRMFVKVVDF